jgi:hypothetical protein
MNTAIVLRTLSLIPDRVARAQSGSLFDPAATGACAHPERVAHLARFLDWLGPLHEVTKDDLRIFGLMTPYGKPAIGSPMDEFGELEAEAALEPPVDVPPTLPLAADEPSEPALN